MKKTTFIFLLLLYSISHSQTTNKGVLANLIYNALYGINADPAQYPAANYPLPFSDLPDGTEFTTRVKLLTYLEFQDDVPVLWRDAPQFRVNSFPYHVSIIKSLLEAWNVPIITSGVNLPYSDVDQNTLYYEYVLTAYSIGMLDNSSQLNPYNGISVSDTQFYITFLSNSSVPTPTQSQLFDEDNYFSPNNYTADNLGFSRGMEQGVFSHYAKNSFVIPDRKMNLNFSHFYSTQMVEIPEAYYPIKPLGRGWSHTYNSYIRYHEDAGANGENLFYIVWPDGTIHIYNEDDNEYLTKSVYDDFDESSSTRIYITKKNQVRYKYQKLDNDRDIYYLTEIRDPNGNEINIDYESAEEDDTRRIEEVEAPSGKKLEFTYYSNSDLIRKIEDPINRKIEFEYSNLAANYYQTLVSFEDAKGNVTTYQYNNNSEYEQYLLKRIDLPRGNELKAEYDDNGKLESYQVDGDDPTEINVHFDHANNSYTSEVKTPMPTGDMFVQDYTFNDNGMVTEYESNASNVVVEYPNSGVNVLRPTETTSNGVKVEYDYDNHGNVTRIDKEDGDIIEEFEYDNDNNLTEYTDGEGNTTKFFYDSDENLIRIEDAYGNLSNFTYDTHGQLISKTNQEGIYVNYTYEDDGAVSTISAAENINSSFNYDDINRLLNRNDNGLISSYLYDENDNITQFTNSGGFVTSYIYDPNDNLLSITNANNVSTNFTYDDEDRVIQEQFGTLITQFDYGDEGYLEEITKPSGQDIDYDYDDEGRLKETGTITDIDYNDRNLVEDITNATGRMEFRYDDLNRLERFDTVHGYRIEYDYTDTNQIDDIEYPTFNGVDVKVNYSYDNKNRIWQVILLNNIGSNGLVIAEYEYFDDDRIKWIDLGNNTRIRYSYDNAGRLKQVQHSELGGPTLHFEAHELDPRGNIIETDQLFTPLPAGHNTNTPSSATNTYGYDNTSQITTGNGEAYNVDNDGNTISFGQNASLTFDIDDRLTSYSDIDNSLSFKYNPYNQRVEATRNGVTKKYVRDVRLDNVLVELDSNNNPIQYFIYAPNGMLLCRMMSNGDLDYYHGDIRGSVVMITDENANITHQYRYDDFGIITRWSEPNNSNNPFRYVGIYGVEYETNDLYYMRARYYKPSIGRFLSEDPIWSTNLYPYADNNPIVKIDPYGETAFHVYLSEITIGVFSPLVAEAPTTTNHTYADENGLSSGIALMGYLSPGGRASNATNSVRRTLLNGTKNTKLRNIISGLYRDFKGKTIGDGGAIDALRYEMKTGLLVGGKSHKQKIKNNLNGLLNLINSGTLNANDSQTTKSLITKMINALLGK